jgi:hypothetical protein
MEKKVYSFRFSTKIIRKNFRLNQIIRKYKFIKILLIKTDENF